MPSHTKGQYMPTFLGGSDLGVPVTSKDKALARRLDRGLHEHQQHDARWHVKGGVIPNTTIAREDQRLASRRSRRSPRRAKYELVRPVDAELGQRRERERAPEHAQRDPPEPRQDARSSRSRRAQQITQILNACSNASSSGREHRAPPLPTVEPARIGRLVGGARVPAGTRGRPLRCCSLPALS